MLRGWFESTFGDGAFAAQAVAALVFLVLLLAVMAWFFGKRSGKGTARGPVRGRQPRLSVMEAAVVDSKRRLVLVRRDQIEHLVMIGGPSDIVVETNIIRGRPASHAGRRSAPGQRAHAQPSAGQPPAQGRQMPAAAIAATSAAATAAAVLGRPGVEDDTAVTPVPSGNGAAIDSSDRITRLDSERKAVRRDDGADGAERSAADAKPGNRPAPALNDEVVRDDPSLPGLPELDMGVSAVKVEETPAIADPPETSPPEPEHDGASLGAGSAAFAGLAAGAAALAAAAGSKSASEESEEPVSDVNVESDQPASAEASGLEAVAALLDGPSEASPPADQSVAEPISEEPVETELVEHLDEAIEPPVSEPAVTEATSAADPFADLESEFKKAFETSLQDLKAEVHAESGTPVAAADVPAEPDSELAAEPDDSQPDVESDSPTQPAEDLAPVAAIVEAVEDPGSDQMSDQLLEQEIQRAAAEDTPAELAEDVAVQTSEPAFETMSAEADQQRGGAHVQFGSYDEPKGAEIEEPTAEFGTDGESESDAEIHSLEGDDQIDIQVAEPAVMDVDVPPSPTEYSGDAETLQAQAETVAEYVEPDSDTAEDEPVSLPDEERPESALPPELAFLDTPATSEASQQDTADHEAVPTDGYDLPESDLDRSEAAPEPQPATSPFPTIPESVRQSVMAAASRPVPPEIAAGLADGAAKDVATTTLGDLAQRLEQALSEQSDPDTEAAEVEMTEVESGLSAGLDDHADSLADSPAAESADIDTTESLEIEDTAGTGANTEMTDETGLESVEPDSIGDTDDGAVIDFNARRREDPEDTLEDEMARLLNDLAGDTNRAG